MVKFEVDKKDLKAVFDRFDGINKIAEEMPREMGKTAFSAQAKAQALAKKPLFKGPKITGNLKNNIAAYMTPEGAVLEAKAKYSPYVEFGTGRSVDLTELEKLGFPKSYAAQFKGKGVKKVNLPARPFFFPSVREAIKERIIKLKKKIKNA